MGRQRGGLKWKQGSDGCIFQPSVACKEPDGSVTPNPAETISKILPRGSIEEKVQTFIRTHFPTIVAKRGVLIASKQCKPSYKLANLAYSPSINPTNVSAPCVKLRAGWPDFYTNFVLETYDGNVNEAAVGKTVEEVWALVQNALNAAVALIPDAGPWVLGYDFHMGNVFVKQVPVEPASTDPAAPKKTISSLADWGRCILIEEPTDPVKVKRDIGIAIQDFQREGWKSKIKLAGGVISTVPLEFIADYPSVPMFVDPIRTSFDRFYANPTVNGSINPNIHNIRITTVHGMLMCLAYLPQFQTDAAAKAQLDALCQAIRNTENQQQIIDAINAVRPGYIDLTIFAPPNPTQGGKRTRKLTRRGGKAKTLRNCRNRTQRR